MLITRCPNCETTFRVRMEQLNQRGGRVRCGHCQIPFSALASLEEVPDGALPVTPPREAPKPAEPQLAPAPTAVSSPADLTPTPPAPATATAAEATQIAIPHEPAESADDIIAPIDLPPTPPAIHGAQPAAVTHDVPLDEEGDGFDLEFEVEDRPARQPQPAAAPAQLDHFSEPAAEVIELGRSDEDDEAFEEELDEGADAKSAAELEDDALAEDEEEPEPGETVPQLHTVFLDDDLRRAVDDPEVKAERARKRRRLILANFLLLVTGAVLSTYALRVEIARRFPNLRPQLEQVCAQLSCSVPYPRDADAVELVGSDLSQAVQPAGAYHLSVTVRNKARYPVAWPQLEITLTDRFERALTRRVLEPSEWLPAEQASRPSLEAQGEMTAQITLSSESQVMGYRLGVFYR